MTWPPRHVSSLQSIRYKKGLNFSTTCPEEDTSKSACFPACAWVEERCHTTFVYDDELMLNVLRCHLIY